MALEGKIEEFGAVEIIQLIAQQQKTGCLVVQNAKIKVEILFESGELAGTAPEPRIYGEPLGLMLLKAGLITRDALAKALNRQQKKFQFLGRILTNEFNVSIEHIQRALYTQVYETFYSVLQWKEGTYSFEQRDVVRADLLPDLPPVEAIILDALRMIDEWSDIEKLFPQSNMVVLRTESEDPGNLSLEEAIVYNLIDGQKNIEEITDKSLLGTVTTYKILSDLLSEGFIKVEAFSKRYDDKLMRDLLRYGYLTADSFLKRYDKNVLKTFIKKQVNLIFL